MTTLATERRFRPEIQGLRALAVLMVVTYHVWFGRVSGGVDVFLFISAFLMTAQFVRRNDSGTRTLLPKHYLHTFRRLIPAAGLVILATLAAGRWLLPPNRWDGLLIHGLSSLFYVENWTLKAEAVDYYADNHATASPFQHFWSLSIQGQIFILWPLLLVGLGWVARHYQLRYTRLLELVFGLIFVVSLTYSVWFTATDQTQAYFDTFARLWEFALGSLLALGLRYIRLGTVPRVILGWAGIVAMLSCGFVVDVEGAFPGAIALWPTLSAAAVIIAGDTQSRFGVDRLLASRPFQFMGGNSYALYLWHWPILVLTLAVTERNPIGLRLGAVVILVSIALAILTTRYVEKPLRSWTWPEGRLWQSAVATVVMFGFVATPMVLWEKKLTTESAVTLEAADSDHPGALALVPLYQDSGNKDGAAAASAQDGDSARAAGAPSGETAEQAFPDDSIIPAATVVSKDWASLPEKCTGDLDPGSAKDVEARCSVYNAGQDTTVLVVGHSHSQQMLPALKPLADSQGWTLVSALYGGCPFSPEVATGNAGCDSFNSDVDEYISRIKPSLLITMATQSTPDSAEEKVSTGLVEMASSMQKRNIPVLAIRDNPRSSQNLAECAAKNGSLAEQCQLDRESVLPTVPAYADIADSLPGTRFIDLSNSICGPSTCSPVVGNVRVYLDDNHLTATYSATLAGPLAQAFEALGSW